MYIGCLLGGPANMVVFLLVFLKNHAKRVPSKKTRPHGYPIDICKAEERPASRGKKRALCLKSIGRRSGSGPGLAASTAL